MYNFGSTKLICVRSCGPIFPNFPSTFKKIQTVRLRNKIARISNGDGFWPTPKPGFPLIYAHLYTFCSAAKPNIAWFYRERCQNVRKGKNWKNTTFIYITTGSLVSQATWLIYLAIIVGLFLRLAIWTLSLLTVHQTGIFIILLYTGQSPQFHNAPTASSHLAVMP